MSFAKTGRTCTSLLVPQGSCCGGALRDTLLDWNDELPQDDLNRATMQCQNADWVLCLGTSLRIEPAGSLPTLAKKGFVIVNLQPTPYDGKAALVIRARVDQVMKELLQRLCECNMDDPAQLEAVVNSDRPVERVWTPANSSTSTTVAISALHPRKDSK
jgi:mono-ADP-ribosyltransferase sirtuin 6